LIEGLGSSFHSELIFLLKLKDLVSCFYVIILSCLSFGAI
jgi:hypothetical protein